MGTGGGADNTLRLIADNSGGTDVIAMDWSNDGKVGIGAAYNTNYRLLVSNGLLAIAYNNNTLTIGSQNTAFTHIYSSASIPFIVNNSLLTTTGNLGDGTYPWNNIYIGKAGTKNIYYVGTKATSSMIRFLDNTSDANGNGISIGGGGAVVIGSGESASSFPATPGAESTYLLADGSVFVESNGDTIANRIGF